MTNSLSTIPLELAWLLDATHDCIYVVDLAGDPLRGRVVYVNSRVQELFGYEPAAFAQDPHLFMSVLHPDDLPGVIAATGALLSTREPCTRSFRVRHGATGEWKWVEDRVSVRTNPAGEVVGYQGIARDISHTVQREAALHESEQRFQRYAETTNDVMYRYRLTEPRGFEYVSPSVTAVMGYTPEEHYAEPDIAHRLVHPEDRELLADLPRHVSPDAPVTLRWIAKSGKVVWTEERAVVVYGPDGTPHWLEGVSRDVTDRKAMQARQAQYLRRLEALRNVELSISGSADLRVTLDIIVDQAMTHLEADAVTLRIFSPETLFLEPVATRGFLNTEPGLVQVGEGFVGRVALERRLVAQRDLRQREDSARLRTIIESEGFVAYHGVPLIAKGQLKGVLSIFHRQAFSPDHEWLTLLEALAQSAAVAIDSATMFEALQQANSDLLVAYEASLEGWVRALDLRDNETEGHSRRVTELSVALGRELGLRGADLQNLRRGALLHDIGKMGVRDAILRKPGPLTDEEWVEMRQHPEFGWRFLKDIPFLNQATDVPYCHHEKWDGTGYPRGLAGEAIPLAARIFAVVDIWDALRSTRPYRDAWPEKTVRDYLHGLAGTALDPHVVSVFLALDHPELHRDD